MKGTRVVVVDRMHAHWGQAGWLLEDKLNGHLQLWLDDGTRCGILKHQYREV